VRPTERTAQRDAFGKACCGEPANSRGLEIGQVLAIPRGYSMEDGQECPDPATARANQAQGRVLAATIAGRRFPPAAPAESINAARRPVEEVAPRNLLKQSIGPVAVR